MSIHDTPLPRQHVRYCPRCEGLTDFGTDGLSGSTECVTCGFEIQG